MTNRLSDEELRGLVNNALRGDRDSVTELLRYFTADMYFVSRLYLEDKETAKSSEQQALRKALQKLKESLNSSDIAEWFQTIVRKEALDQLKPVNATEAYTAYYDTSDEYPAPEDVLAYSEDECKVRILKVLDRVEEPNRAAMALRFFDRMSVDEIANELSVTSDGARSMLAAGKSVLAKLNFPVSTLMALCERVNPDAYSTRVPVEDPVFEEPALPKEEPFTAEEPETEPEAEEEPVLRRRRHQKEAAAAETKQAAEQPQPEPVPVETAVTEEEAPVQESAAAEAAPAEEVKAAEPAAEQTAENTERKEPAKRVRKKKKSHVFLKCIIAILLGAAAAGGLYWYLVMNKPKPAVQPQSTPAAEPAETEKQEEKTEETTEAKQEETKPAETEPESTPAEDDSGKIGTAEVIVDEIRVRTGPGTGYDEAGDGVVYGEVFDVYDVSSDNDYMWYRIGDDMWIADYQGEWVTFTPAN